MKTQARKDRQLVICFFASMITAFLTFIYFIVKSDGAFTLIDDFNVQQLTFASAVQVALKEQPPGQWFWNLDLGSSLLNGFGFYNFGSIFYWVSFLFPKTWFPYLIGYLYMFKYVVASCTAYLYLKRFVKNKNYAVVGALLYAFSGFQATNLEFYHFHEVVAFFPLLLIGLESLVGEGKKGLFTFAVFLNCITNYFFFVQEAVFLVIYYVIRFWSKPLKKFIKGMVSTAIHSALGVGMASAVFLPSILYIMGNTRKETAFYLSKLVYDSRGFLFILKGFLLPGEPMKSHSAVIWQEWNSTACYMPFVGLALVLAYIAGKNKDWLKKLLIVLFAISFSPLLQAGFLGFTQSYQRWWYMLILMMALATVLVLDDKENYKITKYALIDIAVTFVFYGCIKWIPWAKDAEAIVYDNKQLTIWIIIAVLGPLTLIGFKYMKILNFKTITIAVMCASVVTTGLTIHYYRENTDSKEVLKRYTLGTRLNVINDQYRYNTTDNLLTLTGQAAGIGCFSSTIENSSREFDALLDHWSWNHTLDKNLPGLPQLLAGKYTVTDDASSPNIVDSVSVDGTTYYVTESNACPIGYSVNYYITKDSLLALEQDKRAIVLMNAVVIHQEDIEKVDGTASEVNPETINYDSVDTYVQQCTSNAVKDFSRDSSGFTCVSDQVNDSIVFFTVPYDTGWKAFIDDQSADIIDSCGMMSLKIPAGSHEIKFVYYTPGLKVGIAVSAMSWIVFVLYLIYEVRRNGKMRYRKEIINAQ